MKAKTKQEYKESIGDIDNPTIEELKEWIFSKQDTVNFDKNADGWSMYHVLKLLLKEIPNKETEQENEDSDEWEKWKNIRDISLTR